MSHSDSKKWYLTIVNTKGILVHNFVWALTKDVSCTSLNLEASADLINEKNQVINTPEMLMLDNLYLAYGAQRYCFLISYTIGKLVVIRCSFLLPDLPTSNLYRKDISKIIVVTFGHFNFATKSIKEQLVSLWNTFSFPRAIVMALYITWRTAKKNMRMCSWCSPSLLISGTFPCCQGIIKQ